MQNSNPIQLDSKSKKIKLFNVQQRLKKDVVSHHHRGQSETKNMDYKSVFYRSNASVLNDSHQGGSKLFNYSNIRIYLKLFY